MYKVGSGTPLYLMMQNYKRKETEVTKMSQN